MPELPEVETVRRTINREIIGRTVTGVRILNEKVVAYPDAAAFAERVRGRRIVGTGRRGKFLQIDLDGGARVVLHLRMTGELTTARALAPFEPHTHLVLELDDGGELRYADARRFGRFWLLAPGEADEVTGMANLGPEPFDPALTAEYLRQSLGKSRVAVKQALLDQSLVAGIGNIYADEILHRAGIHPQTRACDLRPRHFRALAAEIPRVLGEALDNLAGDEAHPADVFSYRDADFLRVYGRTGAPCPVCGTPIERVVVGGRSSHFCPHCQKKRKVSGSVR